MWCTNVIELFRVKVQFPSSVHLSLLYQTAVCCVFFLLMSGAKLSNFNDPIIMTRYCFGEVLMSCLTSSGLMLADGFCNEVRLF